MVQLKISTGKLAGDLQVVRHFPFCIGRAPGADLRLEEAGVWDQHLELDFDPAQGFILRTKPSALATVNGWPIEAVILRNGDSIEIGSQKINFWIGETKQSALHLPENFVWALIAAVTAAQIGLILWLLK
jgi:pSer/pThr/pTyr-binding forkhead associated (FHA) protein